MAYLVAVTACVSGVAHTYMAAERLEKLCQLEKWGVSIETQGALGTENRLADEDIRRADVALLITDIGKRLARTVLIFTERSDQLSRATDRVPGLPANPGYAQ